MAKESIVLVGTLVGGIAGPGDEATGYILKMGDIDTDASGLDGIGDFANRACVVAGTFEERIFPQRGRVPVLRAAQIALTPNALSLATLRASAFMSGILRSRHAHECGDVTTTALASVAPEVNVSGVPRANWVGRVVAATGTFELVDYVTRGLQFVFRVSELNDPGTMGQVGGMHRPYP